MRKQIVAGNWKMNGLRASLAEVDRMIAGNDASMQEKVDLLVCPPATLIALCTERARGSGLAIGAQDCHANASGAHTGDLSAEMLRDVGASYVIVGHSERRAEHGESDEQVRAKAEAAKRAGLVAIVCVGETRAQREAKQTLAVVSEQLRGSILADVRPAHVVIAYEPVWAIGSGLTPTVDDVAEVHGTIRQELVKRLGEGAAATRILYGGSVKPDNAATLLTAADVDGALVGGASLKAADFLAIARAYS